MDIKTKFNVGDRVVSSRATDTRLYKGIVCCISISKDLALLYAVTLDNLNIVTYREYELVAEPKPDIVYYGIANDLSPNNTSRLISPVNSLTSNQANVDNVKITYDSNGIFKAIEKIK